MFTEAIHKKQLKKQKIDSGELFPSIQYIARIVL